MNRLPLERDSSHLRKIVAGIVPFRCGCSPCEHGLEGLTS